jgi:hypothetical protein
VKLSHARADAKVQVYLRGVIGYEGRKIAPRKSIQIAAEEFERRFVRRQNAPLLFDEQDRFGECID